MFLHLPGYGAPLKLFRSLNSQYVLSHTAHLKGEINVCIAKEWYRFPSSYFLPDRLIMPYRPRSGWGWEEVVLLWLGVWRFMCWFAWWSVIVSGGSYSSSSLTSVVSCQSSSVSWPTPQPSCPKLWMMPTRKSLLDMWVVLLVWVGTPIAVVSCTFIQYHFFCTQKC